MSTIEGFARAALACAAVFAFASPSAVLAAGGVAQPTPPAPAPAPTPPKAAPKHKPYQTSPQNDVASAYQYRTRFVNGSAACQRYAAEADVRH